MAYVAAGASTFTFVNAGSTVNVAVDVSGGTGKAVSIAIFFREASGMVHSGISGVTYNGTSMTLGTSAGGFLAMRTYRLFDPSTGSNNFTVSYSGATGTVDALLLWHTEDGVDTGTAPTASNSNTFDGGAGSTHTCTASTASGERVVFFFGLRDSTGGRTTSSETNFTERSQGNNGGVLSYSVGDGDGAGATLAGSLVWSNDGGDSGLSAAFSYAPATGGLSIPIASYYQRHLNG